MIAPWVSRKLKTTVLNPRWLAKLLLAGLGLLLGCGVAEICSSFYLRAAPATLHVGRWEFRGSCPPPYQSADYFSADFLDESMRCVRLGLLPGSGVVIPGDFSSKDINVEQGKRHTTDQPATFDQRVLIFGGSTMFSSEVPDRYTIASWLQRLVNQRPGPRWRVENLGTSSTIAAQHTERLTGFDLQTGDIVVFYAGVNDVYYPIYNGNPAGWHPGDGHDGGVRRLGAWQRRLYPLCLKFKDRSSTAELLFRLMDNPAPVNLTHRKSLDRHLQAASSGYRNSLTAAQHFAAQRGARFYHFLQPTIFSLAKPSPYEQKVAQNELRALPGLDRAYEIGYPRLRDASLDLADSYDLSGILDEGRTGQEYYLDFCHVNHDANQRIAQAIYDRLFAPSSSQAP
jgi:lysophospholipase L1-like esterase